MASSTAIVSGTSVTWSRQMFTMLRTKRSSVSQTWPKTYHHTWLPTMASISAAVHRLSLRLDRTGWGTRIAPLGVLIVFTLSGPFSCMNALPRRQSRYTAATSAANAATQ
ncbi:MAG: hypothetical protein IJ064_04315 [Bacteroidaceae bacterium]|nr:hypothetical protein [Bacteroidaceae bacterium]